MVPRQRLGATDANRANTNATIKDVARRAGVSVATVSRVLTASAPVRDATRHRILDAARELRFTPNASARSLSTRRTAALGVVLPDLHGEFFSELLRGVDRVAQQRGRHLLVSSSHHDSHGIASALRAMHGRVDGLIVMAPEVPAATLAEAVPLTVPTVMLNCADSAASAAADADRGDVQMLSVDNFGGAVAMVRHLASSGHERIAFIAGAAHNEDARERRRGYCSAMQELGLACPSDLQARGDFTEEGGWRATQLLLNQSVLPTAIFAANDMMAIGAMRAVREHGLEVPRDVAVTGFDDVPTARYVTPALTTVRVEVEALGARAATLLLDRMATADDPASRMVKRRKREVLPSTLVVRASCSVQNGASESVDVIPRHSTGGSVGSRSSSKRSPDQRTKSATHRPAKTTKETV